jgi:hypothetical protein
MQNELVRGEPTDERLPSVMVVCGHCHRKESNTKVTLRRAHQESPAGASLRFGQRRTAPIWRLLRCLPLMSTALLTVHVHDSPVTARTSQTSRVRDDQALPTPLDRHLRTVAQLTPAELTSLLGGLPVAKLIDAAAAHEVAVFGAVWINALPQQYVDAVTDIENFERGNGFLITKRISDPPRLEDFARLDLPDAEIRNLRTCRIGDCAIKLSQPALEQLRAEIDWSKPTASTDAQAFMRRQALQFVTGYLEGGNERLGVYRDSQHPTFAAAEFKSIIDRLPGFAESLPTLQRYLLEYPNASLPGATSFIYWQEVAFGLKPTIRINHVVIWPSQEGVAVAIKMLYASHYFWTALDLRLLVPDPGRGPGFWLVTHARSRSDGLTGFAGWFVRKRAQSEARDGALEALRATKTRLEK